MSRTASALLITVVVVVLDQISKVVAESSLDDPVTLIDGLLSFRLTRNDGAAFSMFQGGGQVVAVLAVGISIWLVILLRRAERWPERAALATILGGAIGNLVDRIVRTEDGLADGAVVDFIDLWVIPTFNVADMAITIGATLLVLLALSGRLNEESPVAESV